MSLLINWGSYGIWQIRDFNFKWHQRVVDFMLQHYYRPHVLYAAIRLPPARAGTTAASGAPNEEQEYAAYLWHLLRGECCLAVVNSTNEEIQGIVLLKWMCKKWHSWTAMRLCTRHAKMKEIITLQRRLITLHAELVQRPPDQPYNTMHVFDYCLLEPLRHDAFKAFLFDVICDVARHMKMPRVTFVALSGSEQKNAITTGKFTAAYSLLYSLYENRAGWRPFVAYRAMDETRVVLCERDVAPLMPYTEMRGFEELQKKLTVPILAQM